MNDDQKMLARQRIDALNAEFAYLIDSNQTSRVPELFLEDGSYAIRQGGKEMLSSGRSEIRAAYELRAARGLRTACHIFTNLHVEFRSPTEAVGSCILLLFAHDGHPPHPAMPLMVARYEDHYICAQENIWRYKTRVASSLFESASGDVVALPLGQQK